MDKNFKLLAIVALTSATITAALARPSLQQALVILLPHGIITRSVQNLPLLGLLACIATLVFVTIRLRQTSTAAQAPAGAEGADAASNESAATGCQPEGSKRRLAGREILLECLETAELGLYALDRSTGTIVAATPFLSRLLRFEQNLVGLPHSCLSQLIWGRPTQLKHLEAAVKAGEPSVVIETLVSDQCSCGCAFEESIVTTARDPQQTARTIKIARCRACGAQRMVQPPRLYHWMPVAAGNDLVIVVVVDVTKLSPRMTMQREQQLYQRVRQTSSEIIANAEDLVVLTSVLLGMAHAVISQEDSKVGEARLLLESYFAKNCPDHKDWPARQRCVPEIVQRIEGYTEEFHQLERELSLPANATGQLARDRSGTPAAGTLSPLESGRQAVV